MAEKDSIKNPPPNPKEDIHMAKKTRPAGSRMVYTRNGSSIICFGGAYFAPAGGKTALAAGDVIDIEVLPIKVTSVDKKVTETWTEVRMTFAPRHPSLVEDKGATVSALKK